MSFDPNKQFKSGKYAGLTYLEVWNLNPGFIEFLADKYGYWKGVLDGLVGLDEIARENVEDEAPELIAPGTEEVRAFFRERWIEGFDMSDYIAELYDPLNEADRVEYLRSLLYRNKL